MSGLRYAVVFAVLVLGAQATITQYVAYLDKVQTYYTATPSVLSSGLGFVSCWLDNVALQANCSGSYSGLTGPVTIMHLHGPVTQGTATGGAYYPFTLPNYQTAAQGTFNQTFTVLAADVANWANNLWYCNIHTSLYGGGEIRGQLYSAGTVGSQVRYAADLTTAQASVTTAPNAYGRGWVTYNPTTNLASCFVYYAGLTGTPTFTHVHVQYVGVAGSVQWDLSSAITAGVISSTAGAASGTITMSFTTNAQTAMYLMSQQMYFNVHTSLNGGGEIRGQLYFSNSANTIAPGTYKLMSTDLSTDCVYRSLLTYEKSCMTVDTWGNVNLKMGQFFLSSCNPLLGIRAFNGNYSLANLGVNQASQRPAASPAIILDKTVARFWSGSAITALSTDITAWNTGCASCPGYVGGTYSISQVFLNTCPATCGILAPSYQNMYNAAAAGSQSTTPMFGASSTSSDSAWGNPAASSTAPGNTDVTYYNYVMQPSGTACFDAVAAFGKNAAGAVSPAASVLVAAAFAVLALFRL